MAEADNLPAWDGRPGAYEVWFLTMTDRATGDGYWIRSTLNAPRDGAPSAGVWFARFDASDPAASVALHRTSSSWSAPRGAFDVRIDGARMASGLARGEVEAGGHRARWDLTYATGGPTFRPLPDALYRLPLAPTRPYAPNVDTRATGTVEVDGTTFAVDAAAQQGHLIGSEHARRWAWAHCADFIDEQAVVQALCAQGRRGRFDLPFLTFVGVRWQDRWIRLWSMSRRSGFELGAWKVRVSNRRYRLTGRIEAPAAAMIRARYEDPAGTERFCHNSEVASCRLALFERTADGFDELALLESRGTTHAEWAGPEPSSAVERTFVEEGP